MRILLFSPKGSGHHYYGPGMNAFRMYQNLDPDSDISLSLVHGNSHQQEYEIFDNQYFISDIINKNIFLGVKFLLKARKWIAHNAHKFDVVHCLTAFHHSFMFSLWFEQEGVPVFIKIGQSGYTGFQDNSIQSRLLGLSNYRNKHANEITGYISISNRIKQNLLDSGIEQHRIHSIPNGVNIDVFHPVDDSQKKQIRKQLNIPDKFSVIFTGAFSDRKNPYLIARAFQKFKDKDIQLLLIGPDTDNGEQRKKIRELISQKNIKNIIVKDFVENIASYYQASDLFVLPSNEEGFSNSMLEAQACGLPAIVTQISGSEELIRPSWNGMFIDTEPESIFSAIQVYYNQQDKLIKESVNARNIIVDNYNSKKIFEKHIKLFRDAKLKYHVTH